MARDDHTRRFGDIEVEISHPEKVLFPDAGVTKADLVDYYARMAPVMLPHVRQRPLTLHRFPDGVDADGFYQQQSSGHFPDWLERAVVPRASPGGEKVEHPLANQEAAFAYLANLGTITLHTWLAQMPDYTLPDRLVFDLDPSTGDFEPVRAAAHRIAGLMEELGMTPHVMTTGSKGLHVLAPVRPEEDFDAVREVARGMARILADAHPDTLTVEQRKDKRGDRLYLDMTRNAYGQTTVAPYALRARPEAPVATPLTWQELADKHVGPRSYTIANIFRRLAQTDDPWAGMHRHAVSLAKVRTKLEKKAAG